MTRDVTTWGLVHDGRAPFVGRGAELAALDEALASARAGDARVVTLVGPAGIGKSRLIQEFVLRHRAPGIRPEPATDAALRPRVYRGSARDVGAPVEVFAQLLRARFGLVEGMDKDAAKAAVRAQIAMVLDDTKVDDVAYFLGQLLGVPGDESPLTRAVADEPQQGALLRRAVLKAFLEADAAASETCLVFEDLHEAHDDSLALLRYLVEYLSGPILVICAARPELLTRQEDWARAGEAPGPPGAESLAGSLAGGAPHQEARHRVVELPPLPEADAATIMRALLAPCEGGPPEALVSAACAFASGNPLLLEQMVRVYHDRGVLSEVTELSEETRWAVDVEKLPSASARFSVDDAVNARLGALDEYETTLLEQAAAMGAVFWSGAFVPLQRIGSEAPSCWDEEASGDAVDVAEALVDLAAREHIHKLPDSSFPGSDEYAFTHSREREALAKRTKQSALRRYHQSIADWMEHQESLRFSHEHVAMLAGHREQAGDPVRAGLAYLEAGDVARARYAASRSSEYYEKGLGLLGDAFTGRRLDALHDYGDVLLITGRVDDALAAFREMLTLAYRLDRKGKGGAAHNRIGRLYRETGSLDDAAKHLETGLALFSAAQDERGVASSIDDIGKLHWLRGEYDKALTALRDGLARRRKLADRRSIALSLNNLGLVLQDSGDFKDAGASFAQALQIRREIGDLVGVVQSLNNLGTCARDQRDYPRALALFTEALEVAQQIGDRNRISMVFTNIGELHYRMGKPAEAIAVLQRAEGLCDELGDKLGLAEALRGLGKAYMHNGDLAKARDAIRRAVDLFAEVRSKVHLGIALRSLGEITAAGGWGSAHTKSAREYFARAATIFEQTGNDVELARTYKVYSRFLLDHDAKTDENARREAVGMNTRAEAIFTRLRITTGPVDVFTGRGALPSRPG
jgi:tetratricopeptide (TPR) repeat protein